MSFEAASSDAVTLWHVGVEKRLSWKWAALLHLSCEEYEVSSEAQKGQKRKK